jgi:hypothetical protein
MRAHWPQLILPLLAILTAILAPAQQPTASSVEKAFSHPVKGTQSDFSSSAIVTTIAGNGQPGLSGDGGPATSASLYAPSGVVSDSKGNVYTTDNLPYDAGVRKIDAATGIITTYAGGNALPSCSPYPACINGSQATAAAIHAYYLAVDSSDNLYISDQQLSVIWRVDAKTQAITVYAGVGICGSGVTCYSGDGGPATQAELDAPSGMVFDASNNLYFSDYGNVVIRVINAQTGVIETVAGSVAAGFFEPLALAFDIHGNLLVTDLEVVYQYDASNASFSVLAGYGNGCADETDSEGDGCLASQAVMGKPLGIQVDSQDDIFISDAESENIRVIDGTTGIITVAAGNGQQGYSGDGGPALGAEFNVPYQIAFDPGGNLYIADSGNNVVREIHYGGSGTQTVATPTFSPAPGTYNSTQSVTISDATTGAAIYYTLDGSTPSASSSSYGGSITVSDTTTIKAIATKTGYTQSSVATATYTIQSLIPTQMTLTGNPNPGTLGATVTFTVDVKPTSGSGTPSGTITTTVDGAAGPTLTLNGGTATYSSSSLTVGSHTIVATYAGDSTYSGSTATLVETINNGTGTTAASIAVVSGSGQTTPYGSAFPAPLVVIVKDANGNPVSGAVVKFSDSGLSFSGASATTGSSGEASVMATATASGSLTASASTSGVTGSANFSLTATKVALTVTATSVSDAYNQPIPKLAFTVTGFVNGDTSSVLSGSPTETTTAIQGSAVGTYPITIALGTLTAANYTFGFVNGTLTITSLGTAATPTFSPPAGTYTSAQSVSITDTTAGAILHYTTDGSTPTSNSPTYTAAIAVNSSETIEAIAISPGYSNSAVATADYTINIPPPTFSLSSSPSSATISSGKPATITLTVTPANGFSQAVSFTCAGLPSGYGCSFSPSTVTPAGAAINSNMTISPASSARSTRLLPLQKAGVGLALALLLWPFARRRPVYSLAIAIFAIACLAATGCISSPKSENYTVTITASGGSITKTSSITLTVTP